MNILEAHQQAMAPCEPRSRKQSICEHNCGASSAVSFSSLASHGEESTGSSGTKRRRRLMHCLSVPASLHRSKQHQQSVGRPSWGLLGDKRASLPFLRNQRKAKLDLDTTLSSSKLNEEWDDDDIDIVVAKKNHFNPPRLLPPVYRPQQPMRNIKCLDNKFLLNTKINNRTHNTIHNRTNKKLLCTTTINNRTRNTRKKTVSFNTHQEIITYAIHPIDTTNSWLTKNDHAASKSNALSHAMKTRRVMEYAARNENSYKSSLGLTSPQILGEYLSVPQEVIGIQHLLSGQCTARESLKKHHIKYLLEEQEVRRRKKSREENGLDGVEEEDEEDPHLFVRRMRHSSRISSNMARERAEYVALLE